MPLAFAPSHKPHHRARIAVGQCIDCAKPHARNAAVAAERAQAALPERIFPLRCRACADARNGKARTRFQTDRAAARRRRDQEKTRGQNLRALRRAGGLCLRCGGPHVTDAEGATPTLCAACAESCRRFMRERDRKRLAAEAAVREAWQPRPKGKLPRLIGPSHFNFQIDRRTLNAYREIKTRDAKAQRERGGHPGPWQNSRIIRDIIRGYADTLCKPRLDRPLLRGCPFKVILDAETRAILDRQAASFFGGSRAACLREMILQQAVPRAVAAPRGPYYLRSIHARLSTDSDPWND